MLRKFLKHTKYSAVEDDLDALGDPATEAPATEGGGSGEPGKSTAAGAGTKGSPLDPNAALPGHEGDTEPEPGVVLPVKPAAAQPMSPELEKVLAKLAEGQEKLTTAVTPKAKPATPEELRKQWKVWEATPDYVKAAYGLDENATPERITQCIAAEHARRDGFMQQTGVFVQAALQQVLAPFQQQMQQFQTFRDEQTRVQLWSDFNGRYPALADEKFKDILRLTSDSLADKDFKDNSSFFDALAKGAAGYITRINPAFTLGEPQSTGTSNAGKMPKLPRGGAGGGGGAAKGHTPTQTPKDDIESLGGE